MLNAKRQNLSGSSKAGGGGGGKRRGTDSWRPLTAHYDGYGSCPLTVEKGKVVLAEFGYDGKLLPTFPLLDATQPSRMAWWLKAWFLPRFYWAGMLRGVEWFAGSKRP